MIASEYTIASDVLMLTKALRVSIRFKGAEDPAGTVLRTDYSPSVYGSAK
jgi:hypothetical protein